MRRWFLTARVIKWQDIGVSMGAISPKAMALMRRRDGSIVEAGEGNRRNSRLDTTKPDIYRTGRGIRLEEIDKGQAVQGDMPPYSFIQKTQHPP